MMVRIKKRTTSGKVVIRKKWKRPGLARCAGCGKPLHGVPALVPSGVRKLAKTKRRPSRPYGGYYCSKCSRSIFRERVRKTTI